METLKLAIGEHTVEWRAPNYEPLLCEIDVTETGIICLSDVVCGKTTLPSVKIIGWTVTGHLKPVAVVLPTNYAEWVQSKGGSSQIELTDVYEIINALIDEEVDLGFTVMLTNVYATIVYFIESVE